MAGSSPGILSQGTCNECRRISLYLLARLLGGTLGAALFLANKETFCSVGEKGGMGWYQCSTLCQGEEKESESGRDKFEEEPENCLRIGLAGGGESGRDEPPQ